VIPITVAD